MEKKYSYFQPEYVGIFQCNGQLCNAMCCRKNWLIIFDKNTREKLIKIKKDNKVKELTKNLIYVKEIDGYILNSYPCPGLTEDNFCGLQLEHGTDYLPNVCNTYPRTTVKLGDFYERSLTLTCPVVASMVLLNEEPMKFSELEVPAKIHDNNNKISINQVNMPPRILNNFKSIQIAAIRILQERRLTIDHRLILLGLYLDKLDKILRTGNTENIEKIVEFLTSEEFLKNDFKRLTSALKFHSENFLKIMFNLMESIYGGEHSRFAAQDKEFIEAFNLIFKLRPDENGQISIRDIAERYGELKNFRNDFVNFFSTVFENYLVNEFFMNLYPFKTDNSTVQNFGLFVTIYKLVEILTFCYCLREFISNKNFTDEQKKVKLVGAIMKLSGALDHNKGYMEKIIDNVKGKENFVEITESLIEHSSV